MKTVIAFIFMFGLLVFVHEFGHLIFAKRAGMLVREFAIGFGPKMFSFKRDETVYTIRLLPIGGYVRVAGEDPEIIELRAGHHIGLEFNEQGLVNKIIVNNKSKHPNARVIEVERSDLDHELIIEGYEIGEHDERLTFNVDRQAYFVMDELENQIAPYDRQFASKTVPQRAMQLFAGPLMNFLLAITIFIILGFIHGTPTEKAVIADVVENSPADMAGFQANDEIIEIEGIAISSWNAFTEIVREHPNESLAMVVARGSETFNLEVTPQPEQAVEIDGSEITIGQIGVYQGIEKSFIKTFKYGFVQTYETTTLILKSLSMLITGQVSIDMLAGPVGIYDATDQVVQT
ncbi:MAG TPA: RIP metalloprotease RseP, partial [Bacillota bacterium]|nr:RIP metalloprotease RseP [Bacillota bacterium]